MGQFDHIEDPDLRELYEGMHSRPYRTIKRGEELLVDDPEDPVAILEAMREATQAILGDIDEHGDANLELYGDHNARYFKATLKKIDGRLEGRKGGVFAAWKKAYDAEIDKAADEMLAEMNADERLGIELFKELKAAEEDPPAFLKSLAKVKKIQVLGPQVSDGIVGLANNLLISCARRSDWASGVAVLTEVLDLKLASPKYADEFSGNAVAVAQGSKDRKVQDRVLAGIKIWEVTNPRLAFNVACLRAVRGEKAELLTTLRRAVAMGRPKATFLTDSDFESYLKDPDFLKIVG